MGSRSRKPLAEREAMSEDSVNRVCALFGIRLPLVMGAITPRPQLGAVVSNAGGLGCIEGISSPAKLREQIRSFRTLSDAPFSVNFPLAFGDRALVEARAQVAAGHRDHVD